MPPHASPEWRDWTTRIGGSALPPYALTAYITCWKAKEAKALSLAVPQQPAPDALRNHAAEILAYWRRVLKAPGCAAIARHALQALSIPISKAVVKRSFSILYFLSDDTGLHAGAYCSPASLDKSSVVDIVNYFAGTAPGTAYAGAAYCDMCGCTPTAVTG